jgi:hypothetical protein
MIATTTTITIIETIARMNRLLLFGLVNVQSRHWLHAQQASTLTNLSGPVIGALFPDN